MAESIARIGLVAAGSFFGGPIGGVLAGALGNALFGQESVSIEGPRSDTTVTSSAHGQPMTMVLGTKRVAGQLWHADEIREVKKEEGGGKGGGGPSVTTYEYFGTFMMFIAEVPEKGLKYKIRRVWRNKKLVYDRTVEPGEPETVEDFQEEFGPLAGVFKFAASQAKSDVFENYVTFYDGADDQEPDPTLEALHGAGNVPAYRGMAYMVAKDMPLADTGNQIGSYEFEVVLEGNDDSLFQEQVAGKTLYAWTGGLDPRNGRNRHTYESSALYDTLEEAVDNAPAAQTNEKEGLLDELEIIGWSYELENSEPNGVTPEREAAAVYLHLNFSLPENRMPEAAAAEVFFPTWAADNNLPAGSSWYVPGGTPTQIQLPAIYRIINDGATVDAIPPPGFEFVTNLTDHSDWSVNGDSRIRAYRSRNVVVLVRRYPEYPATTCSPPWRVIPEAPEWCINTETGAVRPNLQFTVQQQQQGFVTLQDYAISTSLEEGEPPRVVDDRPIGPTMRIDDPRNTEEYWSARATQYGIEGDYVGSPSILPGYPVTLGEAAIANFDLEAVIANPITLAEALRLIHKRAGITSSQIDTTAFGDKALWGMSIQGGTARSYIEALRTWGWFDWIESDGKLKGVPRGSDPVMTVDADDLGASTGEPVPRLQQERTEDLELPERVRIRYPSLNAAYQPGQQTSERLVTESRQVVDVDMSVADTDAHAAQAANIVANEQWRSRMGRELSLPRQYDRLEPADVFSLTLDGVIYRLRVEEKTYQGAVQLRVVDDEAAEYTSEALAGTVLGGGTLGPLAGPTDIQVLDLPALDDAHDSAGYYIAAWGYTDGWGGCVVQRSADGGETFDNLVTIADEATVGEIVNPPAAALSSIIDQGGFIDVEMIAGDLADTNELGFLNGTANVAAIGAPGRWHIVSFRDVEDLDVGGDRTRYRLTYLLQGRLGTEHAIGDTQPGDRFVLLNTALSRVSGATNAVGVSQLLRGVTFGTDAANADNESTTPQGVALKPWAPAHLSGQRDDDGNLRITWTRRTRLGGGWQTTPLYEQFVRFELEVLNSATQTVVNTYTVAFFTDFEPTEYLYTDDQQTTDFGSAQSSVLIRLYQISATVGRGYVAEATL